MGILDTTIETFSEANEREMRKDYLTNWIKTHTPIESKIFKVDEERKWGRRSYNEPFIFHTVIFTSPTINQRVRCLTLDALHPANGVSRVTTINQSSKINIKPDPDHRYIISDIKDEDLNTFELRSFDKRGGILYCINCTPRITEKSKKWRYVFFRTTEDDEIFQEVIK